MLNGEQTISKVLASRAGDGLAALRFVDPREPDVVVPYTDLATKSARTAASLRAHGLRRGSRLALMLRSDLDFVHLFLGAAAGGVVPMALYPPVSLKRIDHYLNNLRGIIETAKPDAIVVDPRVKEVIRLANVFDREDLRVLTCAEILGRDEGEHRETVDPREVAFIQCTSGSTSTPKLVTISHENLFGNLRALAAGAHDSPADTACSWLPMYHDMGLIAFLRPLTFNFPLVLMEPETFLRRPAVWLRSMSTYKGTLSASPNFCFDLCVRKVEPREREGLDLSAWRVAYNGAEPIGVEVVRKFIETYEPYGFRPEVMLPCYGMSESTLAASLPVPGHAVLRRAFDRRTLERGEARSVGATADKSQDVTVLVGVGKAMPQHDLRIIDQDTDVPVPEGRVGRIMVTGPSVTSGYLNRPDLNARTFGAWVAGDERTWLRTNDLGFFHEGELFIVGRADDVLIIRGRNIYLVDIDAEVEAVPGVRAGCSAAVPLPGSDGAGEFAVVVETRGSASEALRAEIRSRISGVLGIVPKEIVFVPNGTISKTSSGKICRAVIRDALIDGDLPRYDIPDWMRAAGLKARIAMKGLQRRFGR